MSERRYSINEIADIYQTDRDRVSQWLDWWEQYEFEGLDDDPRSGRPPALAEEKKKKPLNRSPRAALNQAKRRSIADEIGKVISGDTLQKILRSQDYIWKQNAPQHAQLPR
ncbi:MAG: helix-turn-helix domain-containing protein [Blastocatellales bacterium]|nr:helix-turn-helix domain-containing protein [Blastocatellales bacterium]